MARVDLSNADLHRLLDFAALTREVGWSDDDLRPLLQGVTELVRCDFATITVIHPDPARAWCAAYPSGHMTSTLFDAFTEYAADHPYVQYLSRATHPEPARLTDLVPMTRFRQTALYHEHFRPLGTANQICLPVDERDGALVGLSLNGSGHDFTERDLELVSHIWPHLRGALREYDRLFAVQRQSAAAGLRVHGVALGRLSPREQDVARLVAEGLADKQIGTRLGISARTVQKHVEHILDKLGVRSRAAVAVAAVALDRDHPVDHRT